VQRQRLNSHRRSFLFSSSLVLPYDIRSLLCVDEYVYYILSTLPKAEAAAAWKKISTGQTCSPTHACIAVLHTYTHTSLTHDSTKREATQSLQSIPGRLSPEHRRPGLPERKKMGPAATRTRGLSQMCLDRLDSRALSENHTTSCYVVSMLLIRSGLN
jgi:hypothetical protein